jgi:8-oxo-dGTP diphosphatase
MKNYLKRGIATDALIVKSNKILLIKRKFEPYKNYYALPGGFVEYSETCENACKREVLEETNIKIKIKHLVGVYSNPDRDPRNHTISICYACSYLTGKLKSGDDATDVYWIDLEKLPKKIAFDHKIMIEDFLNK